MTGSILTVPNIITLCRISIIPVIVIILLHAPGKYNSLIAAAIFALASITDFIDGYLARRMNQVTTLGKFLDPLADKLLICVALIMMIPLDRVPPWIAALIIGREILVTGLRLVAVNQNVVIESSMFAKYKTAFQIFAVIALLIHYDYSLAFAGVSFEVNFHAVGMGLIYVALGITLWTGYDYFRKFSRKTFLS